MLTVGSSEVGGGLESTLQRHLEIASAATCGAVDPEPVRSYEDAVAVLHRHVEAASESGRIFQVDDEDPMLLRCGSATVRLGLALSEAWAVELRAQVLRDASAPIAAVESWVCHCGNRLRLGALRRHGASVHYELLVGLPTFLTATGDLLVAFVCVADAMDGYLRARVGGWAADEAAEGVWV